MSETGQGEEARRRELHYLKQQHQLRSLVPSSRVLNADDMISELLSRKEIFQKKKEAPSTQDLPTMKGGSGGGWWSEGEERVPPLYREVWQRVVRGGLADTALLYQLLITSRLSRETLGYIWSLSNHALPGHLTQPELYIALALVALAQNGYAFTSWEVVKQLSEPPIPRLDLSAVSTPAAVGLGVLAGVPTIAETLTAPFPFQGPSQSSAPSALPLLPHSTPLSPAHLLDSSNEFGEFQSGLLLPPPPAPAPTPTATSAPQPAAEDDEEFDDFKSAEMVSGGEGLTVLGLASPGDWVGRGVEGSAGTLGSPLCQLSRELSLPPPPSPPSPPTLSPPPIVSSPPSLPSAPALTLSDRLGRELSLPPLCLPPPTPLPSSPAIDLLAEGVPEREGEEEGDRYSALRELQCSSPPQPQPPLLQDEFGDFLSAEISAGPPPFQQQTNIQLVCLKGCLEVLKEGKERLGSVGDTQVLNEISSHPDGQQYLLGLVEVYRVSRRLEERRREEEAGQGDCGGQAGDGEWRRLSGQIKEAWASLEPCLSHLIDQHLEDEEGARCGVCLVETGPAHVSYGINHFHAPCANLYLRWVEPTLPIAPPLILSTSSL